MLAVDSPGKATTDRRLTELKDAAGLTWDQLAERAGVSSSGLRRIRQGDVVPRAITRQGLAYALHVDQAEIDQLVGADPGTAESPDVTWNDLGMVRAESLYHHRLMTGPSQTQNVISALLVALPPGLLAELTDEEIVDIQVTLADYALYVANKTIQERTKEP